MSIIAADDPVSLVTYTRENSLLDKPGSKRFKYLAKIEKKLLRLQNQVKLRSCRTSPKHKFGYETPRNSDYDHAISLDQKNGNHKWADCIKLEIDQQRQHNTCKYIGTGQAPEDQKRIRVYFCLILSTMAGIRLD